MNSISFSKWLPNLTIYCIKIPKNPKSFSEDLLHQPIISQHPQFLIRPINQTIKLLRQSLNILPFFPQLIQTIPIFIIIIINNRHSSQKESKQYFLIQLPPYPTFLSLDILELSIFQYLIKQDQILLSFSMYTCIFFDILYRIYTFTHISSITDLPVSIMMMMWKMEEVITFIHND